MEDFRFLEEGNYFHEFELYEEESYFFQDFSADYLLGEEAFFSTEHFCASATSSGSTFSQGELDGLFYGDFSSFWALMEDAYRKSKEGNCEKALIKLECDSVEKGTETRGRPSGCGSSEKKALTFELVSWHFSMPIKQAARELNVGLTGMKKRCRELGIQRWPHRKVKSLQTLINNVQELGKETGQEDGHRTRTVVEMLQHTKKLIEERPEEVLDEKTKVLRQVCFKEKFKRRLHGSRHMVMDAPLADAHL